MFASFMGPTLKLHMMEGGGGGKQASCLVAKQVMEYPQVLLASRVLLS